MYQCHDHKRLLLPALLQHTSDYRLCYATISVRSVHPVDSIHLLLLIKLQLFRIPSARALSHPRNAMLLLFLLLTETLEGFFLRRLGDPFAEPGGENSKDA